MHEFRANRFGECRVCGKPETYRGHIEFNPFAPDPLGEYLKAEQDRYSVLDY